MPAIIAAAFLKRLKPSIASYIPHVNLPRISLLPKVEKLDAFDEEGRKPMLWGELHSTDSLRIENKGVFSINYEDDEDLVLLVLALIEAPRQGPDDSCIALNYSGTDGDDEQYILAGESCGATVDREGTIYLKNGRRLRFLPVATTARITLKNSGASIEALFSSNARSPQSFRTRLTRCAGYRSRLSVIEIANEPV
jgi:hypothetical protein